jgi:hypothetical protein
MFQLRIPAPDNRLEWIGGDRPEDEAGEVAYEALVGRGLHRAASVAGCVADLLARRDLAQRSTDRVSTWDSLAAGTSPRRIVCSGVWREP